MFAPEPSSLTHMVLLTACAVASFVAVSLGLIYWSWLTMGAGFILFCYYLSEILRELHYLLQARKDNRE